MISPTNLWIWSYDDPHFVVKSTEACAQAVRLKSYDPIKRVWHSEVPYLLHYRLSVQSLQLCLTLCNPMDCSPPGSSIREILQGYWSGLPCPPPGDLPDLRIKPESVTFPALAGRFFTTNATWEVHYVMNTINKNNSLPFSCLWQICCPEPKNISFPGNSRRVATPLDTGAHLTDFGSLHLALNEISINDWQVKNCACHALYMDHLEVSI